MVGTHGLAAAIRSSTTNETYDLAGTSPDAISRLIQTSFTEPFALQEMIKITLVVGAGKQARQKYDANAPRAVKAALVECGYTEDAGASCVVECGGTFKSQHDTGKNLYTVLVFPKITTATAATAGSTTSAAAAAVGPLIPKDSPGYKIATTSMSIFPKMIASKCPSWSQKRGCISALERLQTLIAEMDAILIKGQPLDDAGQAFYDEVLDLTAKVDHVRNEMHSQVEDGNITSLEKCTLLQQNLERIEILKKEGKPTAKALQRRSVLESITPVPPHKLKYEAEITKLQKELVVYLKMEEKARGRLLSVKETQMLARKDEIYEEIQELEMASRGWFEEEEVFEARVEACRAKFTSSKRFGGGGGGGGGGGNKGEKGVASVGADTKVISGTSVNRWVVPGAARTRGSNPYKKKSRGGGGGGGLFQAMMDSDSDSSDDNDDDTEEEEEEEENTTTKIQVVRNARSSAVSKKDLAASKPTSSKKDKSKTANDSKPTDDNTPLEQNTDDPDKKTKKKKKKKKKKGGKSKSIAAAAAEEDEPIESSQEANKGETSTVKTQEGEEQSGAMVVFTSIFSFVRDYIFPLLLAIITWMFSLLFGKSKKSRKHTKPKKKQS